MYPLTPEQIAAYDQDRTAQYVAGMAICMVMVVVSMVLRLYAQYLVRTLSALDNYLIMLSCVFTLGLIIADLIAVANGGGIHLYRLLRKSNGVERLTTYHKSGWVISVLVSPAYTFVKLSMLAFFYRIFWSKGRGIQIVIWVLSIFVILLGIGGTIEFIVQCLPIHYFWDRAYLSAYVEAGIPPPFVPQGWCMPQQVKTSVPLFLGLTSDVALLGIPVYGVWGLHLSLIKKAGVIFSLSMGIFAIGLDMVRIYECFNVRNEGDVTWLNTPSLIWSAVEFSAAIVCANVPAMSPLIRKELRSKRSIGASSGGTWPSRLFLSFSRRANSLSRNSLGSSYQEFKLSTDEEYNNDVPLSRIEVLHAPNERHNKTPDATALV